MALFTDTAPDSPRRPRRNRAGWIILTVAIIGVAVVAFVPVPYVVEQPGPVFNTLSDVEVDGKQVPLIEIPGEKTYPTDGTLDMLTVSVAGNREYPPSWLAVASAWFDPSKAVLPIDEIYPVGTTVEDSNKQSAVDMTNSQQEAIAAALSDLDYPFTTTLTVSTTAEGSPAAGVLKEGDVVVSVNGKKFQFLEQLQAAVRANGAGKAATVVVKRAGKEITEKLTPVETTGATPVPIIGIGVGVKYDFPIDVKIQLQNVGGPSAGMMFALGIIDKLTTGELNGGRNVAGTGTISGQGTVGPIGGIRQKMYGAVRAGASYFLAPSENCNEVVGHVPDGLTVYSVSTLDDSLAALKAISTGKGASALATCSAS